MIRKRSSQSADLHEETSATRDAATPRSRNYVEIPLPKFALNKNSYTPVLIVALLVASFLLGMLTTKIQYLEKGGTQALVQGTQNGTVGTQGQVAGPSQAPVKIDMKEGHLPVLGDPGAPITIAEFSDFQCPFCKQFVDTTWAQLKKEYIDSGKAKFAFRHLPLTSIHPNAQKAGEAAECANEQDKFWDYHDLLFKNQNTWSPKAAADAATDFSSYATELGLNVEQFDACLSSGKFAKAVTDDTTEGQNAGVTGTPGFFINGYILIGAQPFSAFQSQIDSLQ